MWLWKSDGQFKMRMKFLVILLVGLEACCKTWLYTKIVGKNCRCFCVLISGLPSVSIIKISTSVTDKLH